ncbi:MAG: DUF2339 domain-containing protein [Phycisphaerae bacterium]|nr:DUF2339 domain-containing protein [Phycisphaerae bacterium]
MDELIIFLIFLAIGLALAGPVAVVPVIVLFNKMGKLERRISRIEFKGYEPPIQPPPMPAVSPKVETTAAPIPPVAPTPPISTPVEMPVESKPPIAAGVAAETSYQPKTGAPVSVETAAAMDFIKKAVKKPDKGTNMEMKLGISAALVIGVITVIVGVGFFLKYVYENKLFSDVARVCIVAIGGLTALVIGEVIRRRDYGIVAKGISALGFALLYAAVFSANKVYGLIELPTALIAALVITAGAMAYAVCLNERLIAFLSLLGGYLSPLIIVYKQDLPVPVFSYVLVLSIGAIACAMFRRWRLVNWVAMIGTYLLYTVWFEQFYRADQLPTAMVWLCIYGSIYLIQPLFYGLIRKIPARAEDVGLVVLNSIAVFYYLYQMLYADYQQELALAVAGMGLVHLSLMGVVIVRCRDDNKLTAALGVLGTAFVTTAIGLYFSEMQPKLLGWAIEAVVLTFIGIRYQSLWTKAMSLIVAGIASAGLFYHLPLHDSEAFKVFLNAPFGTWLFVGLAIIICHGLWRFMRSADDEEGSLLAQVYFIWGRLLLATGVALEWYAHCSWHIEYVKQEQAYFLMGLMVIASILVIGFFLRPICPKGNLMRIVAALTATVGVVFTGMAMMGVYYHEFMIFANLPFAIAGVFTAIVFLGAWQVRRAVDEDHPQRELSGAMVVMGLMLIFVLVSEQIYSYWYCRNEYGQTVANWESVAHYYMFISWAVYGLLVLFAGIRFDKPVIQAMAAMAAGFSAVGLFYHLPLHNKGDFNFVFNLPFITWVCVSVAILKGHALWRWLRPDSKLEIQLYYTAGALLLAVGCLLEWYAHCRWQVDSANVGEANFMLGSILIGIVLVLSFLSRPLSPAGDLVRTVGVLLGLGGAVYTAYVMNEVYFQTFTLFANIPFAVAVLYAGAMLLAAWFMKQANSDAPGQSIFASLMVLSALVLLWALLSEQIYQFWYCGHEYGDVDSNWRFKAQMYISVSWAIYAAVLLVIGFLFRTRAIRYLSLTIFAVLLVKINLDIWNLRTEYRIATFVTTGLVLVGVSFLYQFLKKKGFFDRVENKMLEINENK